jgi:hypothetical protein
LLPSSLPIFGIAILFSALVAWLLVRPSRTAALASVVMGAALLAYSGWLIINGLADATNATGTAIYVAAVVAFSVVALRGPKKP